MKIKLAAKRFIIGILTAANLLSLTGCGQLSISPVDQLATMRPVVTPGSGIGGGEPFVPASNQPTSLPTKAPPPLRTPVPSPTSQLSKRTASPQTQTPTPAESPTPAPPILYYTQAGDTLNALALRFGVTREEISAPDVIAATGLLNPGQLLIIPNRLSDVSSNEHILPDSEIVYSPSAVDFNVERFISGTGGYLETYKEWRANGRDDAANTIFRVAIENSINPRLLLAILEFQGHWVYQKPANLALTDYPLGHIDYQKKGLYAQLSWAVQMLNIGYYGWRDGRITQLTFTDGSTTLRLAPDLNAGTVAMLYLFSQLYDKPNWAGAMYSPQGLPALYKKMFGDPWERALSVEPLFPATLTQPPFDFPFPSGRTWSFTGGPHSAWGPDGALASLDFAPSGTEHGCYTSTEYATAVSSGLVVRSETGIVVMDLDGDGSELTGWNVMYLHIATDGRPPVGTWINKGEPVGHPSCEGGQATGTHVHIARKYNGEWIQSDGPMPFELNGWITHQGSAPYEGSMTKNGQTVQASRYGEFKSLVTH